MLRVVCLHKVEHIAEHDDCNDNAGVDPVAQDERDKTGEKWNVMGCTKNWEDPLLPYYPITLLRRR